MTVGELCAVCRNWFVKDIVRGRFAVRGGVLCEVPGAEEGQYIRLIGSRSDDGVYRYPASGLCDGEFDGAVWLMAVPSGFEALCGEIDEWEKKAKAAAESAADGAASPYRSEAFGGYEYRRADGLGDIPLDWRDERLGFAGKLRRWSKL